MEGLILVLVAIATVALVNTLAPRLGVAAPLALVVVGVGVSLIPAVPAVHLEPEWILSGVLPPLLYSASVALPAMDFRRDLTAIGGLSVVLVVISTVVIGVLFTLLVPGVGLAVGFAIGAIVSPTDAVATNIVKRLGVSPRVVTMLQGESLLNDASALVLLRSAIAAMAVSVSIWGVAWDFILAVGVAVVVGLVVGRLHLWVRQHVHDVAVGTAISFLVPFAAAFPAEALEASGLVAAVTAGLVTGVGAPRYLSPRQRLADEQNWRTIELLLEGAVFLLMGLQLDTLVEDVNDSHDVWTAVWLGVVVATAVLLIRAAYVAPLLRGLKRRRARGLGMRDRLTEVTERLDAGEVPGRRPDAPPGKPSKPSRDQEADARRAERRLGMIRTRVRRTLADIDYLADAPLGWREGTVLVWAGLRGAVTLAAAQTLPVDTPSRSLLVLVAFVVAFGSLLIQGGTMAWVVRRLGLAGAAVVEEANDDSPDERGRLLAELAGAARSAVEAARQPDGSRYDEQIVRRVTHESLGPVNRDDVRAHVEQYRALRLIAIRAMREQLLRARGDGAYASSALESALAVLDADELSMELRGGE